MKYEDKTKEQLISELKEMHQQITKLNALPDMYEKTEEDLQLLKNLVNQTNDALYVVDPERSYILDFNDTACKTLGYRRSELLKMKVPDVCLSIIDQPTWNKVVEETKEKGFFILEGEQRRKDNSTFTVELNARYVPYDKNDYLIVVLVT